MSSLFAWGGRMKKKKGEFPTASPVRNTTDEPRMDPFAGHCVRDSEYPELFVQTERMRQIHLERQIEDLRRSLAELEELHQKYLNFFYLAPVGFFAFDPAGVIMEVNKAGALLLGTEGQLLSHRRFSRFLPPDSLGSFYEHLKNTLILPSRQRCELKLLKKGGDLCHVLMESIAFKADPEADPKITSVLIDISDRVKTTQAIQANEEKIKRAHDALEERLAGGTAALERANLELRQEIEMRKMVQIALEEKTEQQKMQTVQLTETNTALRVLLRQREADRRELEEKMLCNINELVRPHLDKLALRKLGRKEESLVRVIQANLDDLASSLTHRLVTELGRLSPMETQVVNLIRQGKSTKEIADLMGVATSTVDFHRHNIRRKLNILHKPFTLRAYLNSLI